MKQAISLIAICFVASQTLPTHAQEGKAISTVEIRSDAIDQKCEIVRSSKTSASTETDAGKIVRFDDESVVLVGATRTVKFEKSIPVLGSIPYLGRLFRNIGIGVEKVSGEMSIDWHEIKRVTIIK